MGLNYNDQKNCRQLGEFGCEEESSMKEEFVVREEIKEFAIAMEEIMRKHDSEKGSSWKNLPVEYLLLKLQEEYGEASVDVAKNPLELVDLANVSMMLYHRYKHKINLDKRID